MPNPNDTIPTTTATTEIAPSSPAPTETSITSSTEASPVQAETITEVQSPVVVAIPEVAPAKDTLLGTDPSPEVPKPVDQSAEPASSKEPSSKEGEVPEVVTETVAPPSYDPFQLPEGLTLDTDRVGKFTELLSELELGGKADHAAVQAFGQKAVDFHIAEVTQAVENITKLYQTSWERQRTEWKDAFLKDPTIGGNRSQTTLDAANTFITTHGGTPEEQKEFRSVLESSGLGNHPSMIRILASAGRAMSEGQPLSASKPVSSPKSKTATLYGPKS